MRNVNGIKSVKDVRTTISTHLRSTPPMKDSTYLDVYILEKEKQRLETELDILVKRQMRLDARLHEIRKAMAKMLSSVERHVSSTAIDVPGADEEDQCVGVQGSHPSNWRQMTVEY